MERDRIPVVKMTPYGVAALAVALIGGTMLSGCGADSDAGGTEERSATLYLAGDGELWVVDVAEESARHVAIRELVPGDPPHRIAVRGERLVLWGYDTLATSADHPGREVEPIAKDSWIWIPSDNPEAVWVGYLDDERPNRARGLGELREIEADGTVLTQSVKPLDGAWPYAALSDGLLFTPSGPVVLMDPVSGRVIRSIPWRKIGDMGPVHGNLLASAPHPGRRMVLTDFATGEQRRLAAPHGYSFDVWAAEFAPDGRSLAVPAHASDRGTGSQYRLALVSLNDCEVSLSRESEVPGGYVLVAWSAAGDQVFMTGGERFEKRVVVAYDLGADNARRVDVRVGDFYDIAAR